MREAEQIVEQVTRRRLRRRSVLAAAGGAAAVLAGGGGEIILGLLAVHANGRASTTPATYGRLLVVGDSLTFGSIASLPNNAYGYQVVQGLRARGAGNAMYYLLHGAPGVTTAAIITAYQQMALAPVVDALVVEVGTDDFTQSNPAATFQAQYVGLLGLLRQAAPNAALVCLGTWQDPATTNATGAA